MPASRIDEAVRRFSPEPVLCWCNGQSLESRYSSSVTSAEAPGGRAAGAGVLRYQLGRARLEDAAPMPRFPVITVSATRIYLFSGPVPGPGGVRGAATRAGAGDPRRKRHVAAA
jgi:hypothetical protein